MSDEKAAMIEILSSILSRLVNVALCVVLTSIARHDRRPLGAAPPPPPVAADLRLVRPLRATDRPEPVQPAGTQAQRLTASAPVRLT